MAKAMVVGPIEFTPPRWAGDFVGHDSLVPTPAKLRTDQFAPVAGQTVVVGAAGAIVGATTVPVDALAEAIPAFQRIDFGTKGIVTTTAAAAAAATSITVEPLETALVDNDEGDIPAQDLSHVPSGTIIGRTFVERAAGTGFGPAVDTDEEIYILAFDVPDVDDNNDCELYRPGRVVKENYLPEWGNIDADLLAIIRTKYVCITGKE